MRSRSHPLTVSYQIIVQRFSAAAHVEQVRRWPSSGIPESGLDVFRMHRRPVSWEPPRVWIITRRARGRLRAARKLNDDVCPCTYALIDAWPASVSMCEVNYVGREGKVACQEKPPQANKSGPAAGNTRRYESLTIRTVFHMASITIDPTTLLAAWIDTRAATQVMVYAMPTPFLLWGSGHRLWPT
ncbi:hypothetical protein LX32DRAFT_144454 [Colletotrichum zoysiae]|uniref:Uncharacterized protein n=1 Tax=Colletotrichum zoysiae TaxID=1216348 RepID=A0AAD9H8A9_9PEZI|nr:hypothetical protein LX32DRAFT_144454 [Colletotrichum zoysiae]